MRTRKPQGRKAKTSSICLLPEQEKFARQRAFTSGIAYTQYFQRLLELDRQRNLLPEAMSLTFTR